MRQNVSKAIDAAAADGAARDADIRGGNSVNKCHN